MSHGEIPKILSVADVFISTSLSDGNNVSLNEAMACGAFPIVSNIPANREWIDDGVTGFLIDPADSGALARKVITALGDPHLRQRAAARNREVVQNRGSWDSSMSIMRKQYEVLIAKFANPATSRLPSMRT